MEKFEPAFQKAEAYSLYFKNLLIRKPELKDFLKAEFSNPLNVSALFEKNDFQNDLEIKHYLRQIRQKTMAHLILRDLNNLATLNEVFQTMTALAEYAVNTALNYAQDKLSQKYGTPQSDFKDLIIIGMGKLGGRELNVSSDIDLIFLYAEEGETTGSKKIEHFEYFNKVGKLMIQLLNDMTDDGQVFRVDMRLRPNGESGALVMSFLALEHYFIKEGREWERYAWIKARILNKNIDKNIKNELKNIIQPFIFRKYLDFGAINAMRDLHAQIRREVTKKDRADDIKLGAGGIREIEFIAQVFQLIRGGRYTDLQTRATLNVLPQIKKHDFLSEKAVDDLIAAYCFLRKLEHFLQYINDQQTHRLPSDLKEQNNLSHYLNFDSYADFLKVLNHHREIVKRHFDSIFKAPESESQGLSDLWFSPEEHIEQFKSLGFQNPNEIARQIQEIRHSKRFLSLIDSNRARFEAVVPLLIEKATGTPNPDQSFSRALFFLDNIAKKGAYLALLQQFPLALQRVVTLLSASSWAAEYLNRYPLLLDELIDPRLYEGSVNWAEFQQELDDGLNAAKGDTAREMDILREIHHAQLFRILAKDLAGLYTIERVSDLLTELADTLLATTLPLAWRTIKNRHCDAPHFAIISYGKLGGKELGYASDLDLVFLFEDDAPDAFENYSRLAQRLTTWLSSRTNAGALFQIDLRLRPNGESGLIVLPFSAFQKYQKESAWVWEHQALTRARFSAGDSKLGEKFESFRSQILQTPREKNALKTEILKMRHKISEHKGQKKEGFWDIKHDSGGLIDVEFIVQYLVLLHAAQFPLLTQNAGNTALLMRLGDAGIIDPNLAAAAANAYRDYRRRQHFLRLNDNPKSVVPFCDELKTHATAVQQLFKSVFE